MNDEVTGSNPVEALIFFQASSLISNCLNWKFTAMIILHFQLMYVVTLCFQILDYFVICIERE